MPPRPGRTPFKAQERDRRYKAIVESAAGHPWGTHHVLPVTYPDKEVSKKHAWKIRSEARFQGYGVAIGWKEHKDGTVTLSFRIFEKASAQQYIADKAARGVPLRYNARRPRKET
jgi:hypothetical protein